MAENIREIFWEWQKKYKDKFGERFVLPEGTYMTYEKAIEVMKCCIENNKIYDYPEYSDLPEGCMS